MAKATRVYSTLPTNMSATNPPGPVDPTRRRFLSQAAGVAAGGAVLALATIPPVSAATAPAGLADPVFGLIEAHRTATAAHTVALKEQERLESINDPFADSAATDACHADVGAFDDLIQTAPTTFAGLVAWASYLHEIRKVGAWMLEGEAPTLVDTLVEALGNLAVTS
jgi:hypothetical protein